MQACFYCSQEIVYSASGTLIIVIFFTSLQMHIPIDNIIKEVTGFSTSLFEISTIDTFMSFNARSVCQLARSKHKSFDRDTEEEFIPWFFEVKSRILIYSHWCYHELKWIHRNHSYNSLYLKYNKAITLVMYTRYKKNVKIFKFCKKIKIYRLYSRLNYGITE